jgi:PhnB protein
MAEKELHELLDDAIGGAVRELADPELAMLLVIASDLRGLPDPRFKQELKRRILPMTTLMEVRKPAGFATVTPYLVGVDVRREHEFLEAAFGAEVQASFARPDGSIMHSVVAIDDALLEMGEGTEKEVRPCELHLYVPDVDATYARALAAGARSLSAPRQQPYGDREAGIVDPMGNHWYVATHGASLRPEGLRAVTPFLHAHGAATFIDFMRDVFGARETSRDTDPAGTIRYASVVIGDATIELSEAHGPYQPMPTGLHVFVDDTDRVYDRAVAAGAQPLYAPRDEPYGQRVGGIVDENGNQWFIATML